MREILRGLAISLAIAFVAFGVPITLYAFHCWGVERGRQEERREIVDYGLGQYVFDARTGEAHFSYGPTGETSFRYAHGCSWLWP